MNPGPHHPATLSEKLAGPPTLRDWNPGAAVSALAAEEIGVWLVDLDAGLLSPSQIDFAEPGAELDVLDAGERGRAARFVRARDRRRFARCRRALREILGGLLGEHPGSLRFRAIGRGKPELDYPGAAGGPPPLRFNVSHSSHLAVIAICKDRELGVDIEQQRPIGEAERIVESFFSAAEQAEFATIAHEARPLAFVRGWTRKEAILKGLGVGIAGLADRHETGFGTGEMPRQFAPAVPCARVGQWQLWEASPHAGFVATVACQMATATDAAGSRGRGDGRRVRSPSRSRCRLRTLKGSETSRPGCGKSRIHTGRIHPARGKSEKPGRSHGTTLDPRSHCPVDLCRHPTDDQLQRVDHRCALSSVSAARGAISRASTRPEGFRTRRPSASSTTGRRSGWAWRRQSWASPARFPAPEWWRGSAAEFRSAWSWPRRPARHRRSRPGQPGRSRPATGVRPRIRRPGQRRRDGPRLLEPAVRWAVASLQQLVHPGGMLVSINPERMLVQIDRNLGTNSNRSRRGQASPGAARWPARWGDAANGPGGGHRRRARGLAGRSGPPMCKVCGEPIDESEIVVCASCNTPHHRDCWEYIGACSIYGCNGKVGVRE